MKWPYISNVSHSNVKYSLYALSTTILFSVTLFIMHEADLSDIELHLTTERHVQTGFANILPTIMWKAYVRWSQIIEKNRKRSINILPGVLSYIAALVNWLLFIHSYTVNYPENHCLSRTHSTWCIFYIIKGEKCHLVIIIYRWM